MLRYKIDTEKERICVQLRRKTSEATGTDD
jgi:hypothetical protein